MIDNYTLPEVLNRLADIVDSDGELARDPSIKQALNDAVLHLEKATTAALLAATLKQREEN